MFTAFLMVLCMAFPVFSAEKRDKTVLLFEDGSYLVIMLEADPQTRAATPTASKSYTYYNSNDERQWIFMLRTSFMYDGTNSEAISAEAAYTIVNRDWVLTDLSLCRKRHLFFPHGFLFDGMMGRNNAP